MIEPVPATDIPFFDVFDLRYSGTYSLFQSVRIAARASFVEDKPFLPCSRSWSFDLAFALEGCWSPIAIRVQQLDERVRATTMANPARAPDTAIRERLERILSLEPDGEDFAIVADRDPVIAKLRRDHPGIRPVLFASPYEAAARAIIGHRLPVPLAARISKRIANDHGAGLDIGDHRVHAFPSPSMLATLPECDGLSGRKVEQLRALGDAAANGWLDSSRLRSMPRDHAMAHLQQLAGIGPFSAELIMIRGLGDPDAFPRTEMRLQKAMTAAYSLGPEPQQDALEDIANCWRPYRSWVGLLLRNAPDLVPSKAFDPIRSAA